MMNIELYRQRRQSIEDQAPRLRNLCVVCLQPEFGCYCEHIQKFDPKIKFVILIHPIEVKRRIATGRMSHLCLESSLLIAGQDYSQNSQVNEILENPKYQPMILYPGPKSADVSLASTEQRQQLFDREKEPVLFVIDGTWATARKTMNQSQNLKKVPRICFTPPGPSQFRVRKQPAAQCYSTIEAIHYAIELLGPSVGFETSERQHDKLLYVFDKMVERQLEFIRQSYENPKPSAYRRPRLRIA